MNELKRKNLFSLKGKWIKGSNLKKIYPKNHMFVHYHYNKTDYSKGIDFVDLYNFLDLTDIVTKYPKCVFLKEITFDDNEYIYVSDYNYNDKIYDDMYKFTCYNYNIQQDIYMNDLCYKLDNEWCLILLNYKNNFKQVLKKSEDIIIEAINTSIIYFMQFDKSLQTERICLEVVKNNGDNLYYVNNKSYDICLEAVKQNGSSLEYVPNEIKAYEICLEAIKSNVLALKYVPNENKTYELCLNAVQQNGLLLEFVPNDFKSYELCLEAIKNNPLSLQFILNNIYLENELLYNNPLISQDIQNKLYLEAVKRDGLLLQLIENQTDEICREAVLNNDLALKYVKNQTYEICQIALSKNYYALQYFKNQCTELLELCNETIKNNPECYNCIKNKKEFSFNNFQTQIICSRKKDNNFLIPRHIINLIGYYNNIQNDIKENKPKNNFYLKNTLITTETSNILTSISDLHDVQINGLCLKNIKNQTKELCIEAVKNNGLALQHVINQTEEICIEAIKNNSSSLQYVIEQTETICIYAIFRDIYNDAYYENYYKSYETIKSFKYIKNKTFEICKLALNYDPFLLQFIENQTEEICLISVKKNGLSIKFIENQTEKICFQAVEQTGLALQYIKNQTYDICIKSVEQNGLALEYVEDKTNEICFKALDNNLKALKYIDIQTEEICQYAVNIHGSALIYIHEPSKEVCRLAKLNNN